MELLARRTDVAQVSISSSKARWTRLITSIAARHDKYRRIMANMYNFADLSEMKAEPCAYSMTFNVR